MGCDEYPSDITAAYNLLVHYKSPENAVRPIRPVHVPVHNITAAQTTGTPSSINAPPSAPTFAQTKASVPGNNGQTFGEIERYKCHSFGHYDAGNCPMAPKHTLVQHALLMLTQSGLSTIDPLWILLNSQSKISVFNNPSILNNICASPLSLRALTNSGHQDSTMVGDFPNLGMVCFNPAPSPTSCPTLMFAKSVASLLIRPLRQPSVFTASTAPL